MRVVNTEAHLHNAMQLTKQEAANAFGDELTTRSQPISASARPLLMRTWLIAEGSSAIRI